MDNRNFRRLQNITPTNDNTFSGVTEKKTVLESIIHNDTLQPDQLENLLNFLNTSLSTQQEPKHKKKKQNAKKKKTVFSLSKRDAEIVRALNQYHYLLLDQIIALFFHAGVKNYVREQLKRLVDAGYIFRFLKPTTQLGPKPYIYTLGSKGITYLKEQHETVDLRFRPSEMKERHYFTVLHDLQLNEFLVTAQLLPQIEPTITLSSWEHAWQIKHDPLLTVFSPEQGKAEKITVVADAWLDFRFNVNKTTYQTAVWFELDRGSEHQRQFKQKIRNLLLAMLSESYTKRFHTDFFLIAFATPRDSRRVETMRAWTLQALTAMGKTEYAKLFLFTSLPHAIDPKTGQEKEETLALDAKTLFLSPVWFMPGNNMPLPLLHIT